MRLLEAAPRHAKLKRLYEKANRSFKATRASSLQAAAQLAAALVVHDRTQDLATLAAALDGVTKDVHVSNQHSVQAVFALQARACRLAGDERQAKIWVKRNETLGYNEGVLGRDWIEHYHRFGTAFQMRPAKEERWRLLMIQRLAFVVAQGGSKSLPAALAEQELREHLAHLRAIHGLAQDTEVSRPAGRLSPNPIASHLFPADGTAPTIQEHVEAMVQPEKKTAKKKTAKKKTAKKKTAKKKTAKKKTAKKK